MADNILKRQLDCISKDFLGEVFGRVGRPKWRALTHMFGAVPFREASLRTHRGVRKAEVRWRRGFVQWCGGPRSKLSRSRTSADEARLRFIGGRPPKVRPKAPLQMELAL